MAKILENSTGRKTIRISSFEILEIVKEYQQITKGKTHYQDALDALGNTVLFLPED